jgi:mRNA-degrading endonuclease RelE of RelBE toxin-antitoxin system
MIYDLVRRWRRFRFQKSSIADRKSYISSPVLQIVFNEISAAEMAALPKEMQLDLLTEFQFLPEDLDQLDMTKFGAVERDGKRLFRYRARDYRIYFERRAEGITVHRVLHKNTIRDFLFRTKLPMTEDDQLGQQKGFWQLIEEAEQTRKP